METPNCNSSHAGRTSYGCPYAIHRDEVIAFNKAQSYPIGRTIDLQPVFMKTELAQELWATTHEDSAVCGIAQANELRHSTPCDWLAKTPHTVTAI